MSDLKEQGWRKLNLNYDKIKAKAEGHNQWTAYSDLFMVLSTLFLLLFVVASLRSGTHSLSASSQLKLAQQENDELKRQLKVYEVLREEYQNEQASNEEVKLYKEVIGKLSLLEGEARSEREAFFRKAKDAQEKEQQLNQYQQLVKNIINANMLAQSKLKRKERIIEDRVQEVSEAEVEVADLNRAVTQKEREISHNNAKISQMEASLQKKVQQLKWSYKANKTSKKKMEEEISRVQAQTEQQIASLRSSNNSVARQLQAAQSKIEEKNREHERLLGKLSQKETEFAATMQSLKGAHDQAVAREQKAHAQAMAAQKVSAEVRARQEAEHQAALARMNDAYQAKMAGLGQELESTRGKIKGIEGKYQESIATLNKSNQTLKEGLEASIARQNAQKILAQRLRTEFAKAGIGADVDGKTGDVTLNFGEEYFETGSASLKPGMRSVLERAMPSYALSLMKDPKIAKKINSLEIIGFASPTYKNKVIDPASLKDEDRQAVNYNMDLSYQRAKSIFEYVFDPNKVSFPHQKTLLPLVKVTGRSYLATDKLRDRLPGSADDDQYCKKFDCKKAQRVIIKFNLSEE
jgi:myosin heavy subunit